MVGASGRPGPNAADAAVVPATPGLLRELNERTVLDSIRRLRTVSRAEVARRTGLSKPTVSLALRTLETSGLVRPVGTESGRRGRAGVLYEPVPDAALGIAVEVAVTGVRAVAVDLDGTEVDEWTRPHSAVLSSASAVVESVAQAVTALGEGAGRRFDALVVGTPGVQDPRTGVLHRVGTIPALEGSEFCRMVAERTDLTPAIHNDVDLVALGEQAEGHGRDVEDFAVVWIGSGLGSALVWRGELLVGHAGAAGEIFDVPFARAVESSGGSAEEFARFGLSEEGALALGRRMSGGTARWGSAPEILDAAAIGDTAAGAVLDELATWAAWYVSTLAAIVDPALVVLAGPLGAHDALRPAVESKLATWSDHAPAIVSSKLGSRSVLAGAAAVASRSAADAAFANRVLDRRDDPPADAASAGTDGVPDDDPDEPVTEAP
jgi:predicted NBD/HSP70 family sugar kinase